MKVHKQKKGAMELSMSTIVIVIISVILLTLGITWVTGMFEKVQDITDKLTPEIDRMIEDQFNMGSELAMYATEFEVEQGENEMFGIGIKNDDSAGHDYQIDIKFVGSENKDITSVDISDWFILDKDSMRIGSGDKVKESVVITVPKKAKLGLYVFKADLLMDGSQFKDQQFTITVK